MKPIGKTVEYQNIDFVYRAKILKRAKSILKYEDNIHTDVYDRPHFLAENIKDKRLVIIYSKLYYNKNEEKLEIKWFLRHDCYPEKGKNIAMIEQELPGYQWE